MFLYLLVLSSFLRACLVAAFNLFEMFMCGFPMRRSLADFNWYQCRKVLNRLCSVVITASILHSSFFPRCATVLYMHPVRQLHSPLFFLFKKSRLKIYKVINNYSPREVEDYGGGFVTAKSLISRPQRLAFGCLPCLVGKQYWPAHSSKVNPSSTTNAFISTFCLL